MDVDAQRYSKIIQAKVLDRPGWREMANRVILRPMWDACKLLRSLLVGVFRSRASLEAEILVLRQQIIIL